jgi:hypothetical protein
MKPSILRYFLKSTGLVLLLAFVLSSCVKNFEKINTDPTKLTSLSPSDVRSLFPNALYEGLTHSGPYQQTAQALFADQYAQYFAQTATYFASHRYAIIDSWIQTQWVGVYVKTLPSLVIIINETKKNDLPTLNAIARIWKVFVLHRTTDYYGPIPYSEIGSTNKNIKYDAQKEIYYDFFKELTEAASDLKNNLAMPSYGAQDLIFQGDNAKWLKFANTLRLRLAMRISKIEPIKAKEEAEAAVAAGVFTDATHDALLKVSTNYPNRLNSTTSWNEFRMSTSMESLLVGYNDPRLSKWFSPAIATGQYTGVRNGLLPDQQLLAENDNEHNSNVSSLLYVDNQYTTPQTVMHTAEAYLLRAEGALNGWNMGGTAKSLYEKGIEMSMYRWGITNNTVITDYINSSNLPKAPGRSYNTPALTDIPVLFSTNAEKQREQILTQKWLALFPDGFEAWAEMRRSGYPRFYPLLHSDNPDVAANKMISRIPFTEYDKQRNGAAVKEAQSLLGGPDNAATRLWWDVD